MNFLERLQENFQKIPNWIIEVATWTIEEEWYEITLKVFGLLGVIMASSRIYYHTKRYPDNLDHPPPLVAFELGIAVLASFAIWAILIMSISQHFF